MAESTGAEPGAPVELPGARHRGDATSEGDDFGEDRALLRILGVIIVLGIAIAVLVLPPVSILSRGDGGGVATRERKDLPKLPPGLAARSALYDLELPPETAGPLTLTVKLSEPPADPSTLAMYTYRDGEWVRLAPATVRTPALAEGVITEVPATIAVLERVAPARHLGLLLQPGQTPDPEAGNGGIVAVPAAQPALDAEGNATVLEVNPAAAGPALASGRRVYIGVSAPSDGGRSIVDALFTNPRLVDLHVQRLVAAASEAGADGIYVDYGRLDAALRDPFTTFVRSLSEAARTEELGVIVGVPVTTEANAYDWRALGDAADALWVRSTDAPDVFYPRVEDALRAAREAGTAMDKVWLVVDRRSAERTPEGVARISAVDALAQASGVRARLGTGISPNDGVTLEGTVLAGQSATGLRWDDASRTVSYEYEGRGGRRSVWIENRFSFGFRLDLARRFGLGGVTVAGAAHDAGLPDIWDAVAQFVAEATVDLEVPYGPYLQPEWRASEGAIEGSGASVVWRAPETPGVYDITLVVSDGVLFVGQQIALRVSPPPAAAVPADTQRPRTS